MSAAKWHREQAAMHRWSEDFNRQYATKQKRAYDQKRTIAEADRKAVLAAHHATAADALDALAVPGVADVLARLAKASRVDALGTDGGGSVRILSDDQRASLAALAKIARGQ